MLPRVGRGLDSLIDHYAAACIILALFILSLLGVGDVRMVGLVGILLCAAGLVRGPAQVDLWVLLPLLIYVLSDLASAYHTYGDIAGGYGALHGIFPVLYLLMACLDGEELRWMRRGCALWAGAAAAAGIVQFVLRALIQGRVGRMSGLLGNPNAMGIFLVVGWYGAMCCETGRGEDSRPLSFLEPLLLIALAMTLSMGSFLSMAVGIGVLLIEKKRSASWRETVRYACQILAKASLGMGTGLLIYLAGARTGAPWSCLPLLVYAAAVILSWRRFECFLEAYPKMALLLSAMGMLVAVTVIAVRPSSIATFTERVEMIGSGLRYIAQDPLFGVGPFQWRLLDLDDGGKYFNTWHIHNVPVHIGVEMGWIAMTALILVGIRALCKKRDPAGRALIAAFCFHNMIDTSFFYLEITALVLTAAGEPQTGGRKVSGGAVKTVFALFALLFAYGLYWAVRTA